VTISLITSRHSHHIMSTALHCPKPKAATLCQTFDNKRSPHFCDLPDIVPFLDHLVQQNLLPPQNLQRSHACFHEARAIASKKEEKKKQIENHALNLNVVFSSKHLSHTSLYLSLHFRYIIASWLYHCASPQLFSSTRAHKMCRMLFTSNAPESSQ
jgi:hypothetical protein